MASRRQFIKQSSLFTAALFVNKDEIFKKQKRIGVQLYTVRSDMGKDARGTIEKIAKLGYKEIETFAYNNGKWFGMTPTELSGVFKANGLTSPSGHTFPGSIFLKDGWETNWIKAVEDAKTLGQRYIVIPWLEDQHRKSADNYKKMAEGLNKAGSLCKQAGRQVAYHNHDFEFVDLGGGQNGFDTLLNNTDKSLVNFELDIYWAVKAGKDPVALFEKYPGRFVMWHVKDMDNTEKKMFTEVGNGVIDWKKVFAKAKKSGMTNFFVEQDVCPGPPLESLAKSIVYLKKKIV
jgi:sugar phosphate isomerase/epimerase